MIRLDEIPKKTPFEAPEGYFDKLPGRIQARIATPEPAMAWGRMALRYALPVTVLAVAAFLLWSRPELSPEEMLARVDSEQLVAYLQEADLNTDDLLEAIPLEPAEAEAIEQGTMEEITLDDLDLDLLLDEFDTVGK